MSYLEGPHPLLEPRSLAYTNATVRRAFIVWMHCGQKNSFKDVCNYYHYLESFEDKLPADRRATSRYHEFNMFSKPPPTSPFLHQIFPELYSQNHTIQHNIKKVEATKNDTCVYKLEHFTDIKTQKGVTTSEILDTSHMIKKYCKSRMIHLRKFLMEFKEYARKCELNYTVNSVAFYIKRKKVEEELLMVENYSKSLNFLNLNSVDKLLLTKSSSNAPDQKTESKLNEKYIECLPSVKQDQLTILMKDNKNEHIKQYWNDLTADYAEMAIVNSVTRT